MNKNAMNKPATSPVRKAIKAQIDAAKERKLKDIAKVGPKPRAKAKACEKQKIKEIKAVGCAWGDINLPRPLKSNHTPEWYTAHKFDSQWYGCALDALEALIEAGAYHLAAIASRDTMKELIAHLKKQESAARKAAAKK